MARFCSPLDVRREDTGTWLLLSAMSYDSDLLKPNPVIIPARFRTDFASVPRLPGIYLLAGGRAHQAAVVHDYLYQTHDLSGISRRLADAVLFEAMGVCTPPEPEWMCWLFWSGVRVRGGRPWARSVRRRMALNRTLKLR